MKDAYKFACPNCNSRTLKIEKHMIQVELARGFLEDGSIHTTEATIERGTADIVKRRFSCAMCDFEFPVKSLNGLHRLGYIE